MYAMPGTKCIQIYREYVIEYFLLYKFDYLYLVDASIGIEFFYSIRPAH